MASLPPTLPVNSSPAEFLSGGRIGVPAATAGGMTLPQWRRAWGRVEVPKAPRVGSGSWEGAIAQKADYLDKII